MEKNTNEEHDGLLFGLKALASISQDLTRQYLMYSKAPDPIAKLFSLTGRKFLKPRYWSGWTDFVYGYMVGHGDAVDDANLLCPTEESNESQAGNA